MNNSIVNFIIDADCKRKIVQNWIISDSDEESEECHSMDIPDYSSDASNDKVSYPRLIILKTIVGR